MTNKEKIKIYEDFLHAINMCCVCGNGEKLQKLIENADSWSYSHRMGNGECSKKKQQEIIDRATRRLLKV
jgi:hypothetical protein